MATATETKTLLEFLMDLLSDKQALADFQKDPECALKDAGLEHVSLDDIQDVLPHVLEKIDPEACARYEDDCDEDKCHDDKAREHGENHHPGKHHDECDDDRGSHHGDDHGHEISQVISHLTYVTNNYSYTDNSSHFNNNIWSDGDVTLNQAGTNGIAIGDDNNGVANTGDGAVIGDDNVTGNDNLVGDGNTSLHDFGVGDGSSVIVGTGNAADIDNSDNSVTDNSDNSLTDSQNDNSDNSLTDSGNDNSDNSLTDSGNDNSDNSSDTTDSNNGNTSDNDGLDIDTGDIDASADLLGALPVDA